VGLSNHHGSHLELHVGLKSPFQVVSVPRYVSTQGRIMYPAEWPRAGILLQVSSDTNFMVLCVFEQAKKGGVNFVGD
jgi:hypothetical protein